MDWRLRAIGPWLAPAFVLLLCAGAQTAVVEPITPVPLPPPVHTLKATLGARLFNDARLSGDGTRSCASCHDVNGNGARPSAQPPASAGFDTLTVFNAVLSLRLGWEGKFRSFQEQAAALIESPQIMNGTIAAAVERLRADPQMRLSFTQAYGKEPDRDSLLDALANYEATLLTPNSRFDRWLMGDKSALTAQEERGYRSFKDVGCITCHQGANIGGNLFHRAGIFRPLTNTPTPAVLRVPSLRNVAATAPYFHDGSAPTLTDAIRRMAIAQLNERLTDYEIEGIVAFLGSLTGEHRGRPVGVTQ